MQIYDCEIGVVFLLFNLDTKLQSSNASVYPKHYYAFSSVIEKSKNFKSSQKSGYDLETTSAFSIIIGTFSAKGANAIAILVIIGCNFNIC
jgi:hypothetical protein